MRTQVGIVGAGPAGLLLSHLLHLRGINSVVLELRSRDYVENRIRAGVLEHTTEDLLTQAGVAERMRREGIPHEGVNLRFGRRDHRIDFRALTGRHVMVYSQHKLVQDLIATRLAADGQIAFEAEAVAVHDIDGDHPRLTWRHGDREHALDCDFIAGCDGFHGICRPSIPAGALTLFERDYPFGWLGILAEAPPSSPELVYANHESGFALLSLRSPTVSRLYLQCAPDENIEAWSDDRIWHRATYPHDARGFRSQRWADPAEGHHPDAQLRCRADAVRTAVPARRRRAYRPADRGQGPEPGSGRRGGAGPRVGAVFRGRLRRPAEAYSATCLVRVWKVQRFSWWMTSMLHRFEQHGGFDQRVQLAELEYVAGSVAASTALAENYVGLPLA